MNEPRGGITSRRPYPRFNQHVNCRKIIVIETAHNHVSFDFQGVLGYSLP
ncbi:MAG: hypothetical protein M3Z08_01675 [Chloroflexota bacterium]|nr:hypothetical protein [Chloroflexota bacterium]